MSSHWTIYCNNHRKVIVEIGRITLTLLDGVSNVLSGLPFVSDLIIESYDQAVFWYSTVEILLAVPIGTALNEPYNISNHIKCRYL